MANVYTRTYSSANVTTAAFAELVASVPFNSSQIQVYDSSSKIIQIAIGEAGQEVVVFTLPVSGWALIPYYFTEGQRVSAKALDANATTGYNVLSFFP